MDWSTIIGAATGSGLVTAAATIYNGHQTAKATRAHELSQWNRDHLLELGSRYLTEIRGFVDAERVRCESAQDAYDLRVEQFYQDVGGDPDEEEYLNPPGGEPSRFWANHVARQRINDGQIVVEALPVTLHHLEILAPTPVVDAARGVAAKAMGVILCSTPEEHDEVISAVERERTTFTKRLREALDAQPE